MTTVTHTTEGPLPGTNFPNQDAAPLPWISVLPSKRALDLKVVDFSAINNRLRFNMNYFPFVDHYRNVCLILIDYTILPAEPLNQDLKVIQHKDISYSRKYESKPERYSLTVSFYENRNTPPAIPLFQETITLATHKASPNEALGFMIDCIIEDHRASKVKKIEVDLD